MSQIFTVYSRDSSPSTGAGGWGGANIFFGTLNRFGVNGKILAKLVRSCCPDTFLHCDDSPS